MAQSPQWVSVSGAFEAHLLRCAWGSDSCGILVCGGEDLGGEPNGIDVMVRHAWYVHLEFVLLGVDTQLIVHRRDCCGRGMPILVSHNGQRLPLHCFAHGETADCGSR